MNTNKNKTTKSKTQKQPARSEAENTIEAKTIKLGIDVHLDRYVVVRIIDGGTPQPPQRFEPAEFFGGVQTVENQLLSLDEQEAGPNSLPIGGGQTVERKRLLSLDAQRAGPNSLPMPPKLR